MSYASIEEAWGGISGASMLNHSLTESVHPMHKARMATQQQQMQQQQP